MHRAVMEACFPCVIALALACVALRLWIGVCSAGWDWSRFRSVHRCEEGGVQSLSLVLTLPIFVMLVLFILQVSQLMIGAVVVHYAAFAAARAASVWMPADIGTSLVERENVIDAQVSGPDGNNTLTVLPGNAPNSFKYQRIQAAAVFACAPICPSRDLQANSQVPAWVSNAAQVSFSLYSAMAPQSQANPRISARLQNKLAYSYQNTDVTLQWMDVPHPNRDTDRGPTYNPRGHPDPNVSLYHWDPREIGWEDPITVRVSHRFALLPGPGRFLAKRLVNEDGTPDTVSPTITTNSGQYSQTVYTTVIPASATMTNDGIKSVRPYAQY